MPATPPEPAYDVFISYSHRDKAWVRRELLPRLESAGLKVCIDYRDFRIGAPIIKEMERAVVTSRHTLLVLTASYLTSAWAEFENLMLQTLDPTNQQSRLIPLIAEKVELPQRIGILNYVDLTDEEEAAYVWPRLLAALAAPAAPAAGPAAAPAPGAAPQDALPPVTAEGPPPGKGEWNTAALRELLMDAFTDEALANFCYDYFRPVYEQFAGGMSKPDKVQRLIVFCENSGRMPQLLAQLKASAAFQYNKFESRLRN